MSDNQPNPQVADPTAASGLSPEGPDRAVVAPQRGMLDLLPWRRVGDFDPEIAPVVRLIRHHHPRADVRPVVKAYLAAREAHDGQLRKSGDPYITHPIAVAGILADLGMDVTTITAGLLHDVVEDTDVDVDGIREEFGEDVAEIVDGVTKLERLTFDSKEAQQAATIRKMLVAMAKDMRVLLIKLADRLHNMRSLAPLAEHQRRRLAQETIDIYAPLAHRLGIREIKWQLEDLAFAELHPKTYAEIEELVSECHTEVDHELAAIVTSVDERLKTARINGTVTGRPKHYWSIYQKMVSQQKSFDEINDVLGVRVVVESTRDAYTALGVVHAIWKPILGRFKDYIALPKFNLYQSLHTTVMGPAGRPLEIQIRTADMDHTAEFGIAAHWRYKEDGNDTKRHGAEELAWFRRVLEGQMTTEDPAEFLDNLREDLYRDEVFVFTPGGDVLSLPAGGNPIDFAYAVHTEIGHRCIGARVNDRLVPLDTRLTSGDTVEIFTSNIAGAGPSRDWLDVVATPKARNKIRAWFSRERRTQVVEAGREQLTAAMRDARIPSAGVLEGQIIETVAEEMNYAHVAALFAAIGEDHVKADTVVTHIARHTAGVLEAAPADESPLAGINRRSRSAQSSGVHVEGLDDVFVHLARCCNPIPGDVIIGYHTRGRGVSVHRSDCANAVGLDAVPERVIGVDWDLTRTSAARVRIQIEALDRSGLLADVCRVLADHHANIRLAQTSTGRDQIAVQEFECEIADPSRLDTVLSAVSRVNGVYEVFRVVPTVDKHKPQAAVATR